MSIDNFLMKVSSGMAMDWMCQENREQESRALWPRL